MKIFFLQKTEIKKINEKRKPKIERVCRFAWHYLCERQKNNFKRRRELIDLHGTRSSVVLLSWFSCKRLSTEGIMGDIKVS